MAEENNCELDKCIQAMINNSIPAQPTGQGLSMVPRLRYTPVHVALSLPLSATTMIRFDHAAPKNNRWFLKRLVVWEVEDYTKVTVADLGWGPAAGIDGYFVSGSVLESGTSYRTKFPPLTALRVGSTFNLDNPDPPLFEPIVVAKGNFVMMSVTNSHTSALKFAATAWYGYIDDGAPATSEGRG